MKILKRKNLPFMAAAMYVIAFSSCEHNDGEPFIKINFPTSSDVAYILNQGSYGDKIEGSLNVLDYGSSSMFENMFTKVNERSLGSTPQCGVAYGTRIYLGMYESHTIEVIDRSTFRSIKQIKLEDSEEGRSPRGMVASGGHVYITMNEGYLSRLDTVELEVDASLKVGLNPETPAVMGDRIYVPVSAWSADYGTTGSVVTMHPFAVEKEIDVPLNPQQFLTNGNDLFVISWGNYGDEKGVLAKVVSDNRYEVVGNARMGAIRDNTIYLIDNPWGGELKYWKYDISSGERTDMAFPEIDSPSGIGIDPSRDVLLISSFPMDGVYPSYLLPGYVCEYTFDGRFVRKYAIGAGPACIFFNAD